MHVYTRLTFLSTEAHRRRQGMQKQRFTSEHFLTSYYYEDIC